MSLPGKLCIGILEEDNPLKSYFRFKPLIVEQGGRYVLYDEHGAYPKDGCIRIVPDKNESSRFKVRMRRMGLFAVVDLTEHPNENDKIRVNKNFMGNDEERNSCIIYSDVLREPAQGTLFAILKRAPEEAENAVLPGLIAKYALLRPEEQTLRGVWRCQSEEEHPETVRLARTEEEARLEDLQFFDLPGFRGETLSFAVLPPNKTEKIAEPLTSRAAKSVELAKADTPVEEKRQTPAFTASALSAAAFSPLMQSLAAQSGLNPRRGRSLQEIIDDKWRHSRIDQLGHAVPELAHSTPLDNPIEQAVGLVRELWERADLRSLVVQAFAEIDGLNRAIEVQRRTQQENQAAERLNELEAQRLQMLGELETLRLRRSGLREELKQEIRRDEAAAFEDAIEKTARAREEQARQEAEAKRAKTAAESAEDALHALEDGRFEKKLNEFAIQSRAVELIRNLKGALPERSVACEETDANALVERVMECFADAGRPMERSDAVHLLICAAQSDFLLVSGPTGCGKSETIRLLARALGAEERFWTFAPGKDSLEDHAKLPGASGEAAAMVLLDDANLSESVDLMRGLTPAAERGQFLCCATLQDDARPVSAQVFDRAFLLRLSAETSDGAWKPLPVKPAKKYAPVSKAALKTAFTVQEATLPDALMERMDALRKALEVLGIRLSRRTLTALWNYCAAALPQMNESPLGVLDRALAARAVPAILAGAPLDVLTALPKLLEDWPRSKALFSQSLPIQM